MHRRLCFAVALVALISGATEHLTAQTTATPIFAGPYRAFKHNELGAYLSDPGDAFSLAIEGEYRMAQKKGQFDWGVQLAYADPKGKGGKGLFGVGADIRATIVKHNESFPLDAAVTGGVGVLFRDGDTGFLIPVGVTLGRQIVIEGSSVSFVPWVAPVIAPTFGELLDDVLFGLGFGVDVNITPRFDIRVGAAVGDYEGIGFGVVWHK